MKIKVIDPQCTPYRKHVTDAGIDLCASIKSPLFLDGRTSKVDTGIQVAIPEGYCGLVVPRSGLGVKLGLTLANSIGVIDSDYRGNIFVNINVKKAYYLQPGERFAQLVVVPVHLDYEIVDNLDDTARGDGGFGSSDEKELEQDFSAAISTTED